MPSFVLNIKINWQKNCEYLNRFFLNVLFNVKYVIQETVLERQPGCRKLACEAQTHFRSSLLSLRKIARKPAIRRFFKEEGHMFAGQVAS